jgi:hypothetical protein
MQRIVATFKEAREREAPAVRGYARHHGADVAEDMEVLGEFAEELGLREHYHRHSQRNYGTATV